VTTNTWTVNSDGSVTFNGTVNFPAGTNLASGAGVAIFGPNGGVTNFPAIEQGDDGVSPTLTFVYQQVAAGTALPSPNPSVVFTPASGSTPPNYEVTITGNAGADGSTSSGGFGFASIEGSPAAGFTIGFDPSTSLPQWQAELSTNYYFAGSLGATSSTTVSVKPIGSLAIPALSRAYWPEVLAYGEIIGAVDTQVDLVARLNSSTPASGGSPTGAELGRGKGQAGAAPCPTLLIPNMLAVGSDNIVAAGAAATIFLNAENQTSSANAWNVASGAWFQVKPHFVPA
jgi:hypothetical protein